jgi:hypothetical protein
MPKQFHGLNPSGGVIPTPLSSAWDVAAKHKHQSNFIAKNVETPAIALSFGGCVLGRNVLRPAKPPRVPGGFVWSRQPPSVRRTAWAAHAPRSTFFGGYCLAACWLQRHWGRPEPMAHDMAGARCIQDTRQGVGLRSGPLFLRGRWFMGGGSPQQFPNAHRKPPHCSPPCFASSHQPSHPISWVHRATAVTGTAVGGRGDAAGCTAVAFFPSRPLSRSTTAANSPSWQYHHVNSSHATKLLRFASLFRQAGGCQPWVGGPNYCLVLPTAGRPSRCRLCFMCFTRFDASFDHGR